MLEKDGVLYPDTLVGTDSHTTMINGLGVVGWGVGGIEAEAAMLGQPVYLLMPDVVGVHLHGRLREGVTATDLVLRITELLRQARVVGKFVEFHGEGAANLSVPDRATIANMAPEYGATIGFFPVDEQTCRYLLATGRSDEHVETVRRYFKAQGLFGDARARPVRLHAPCSTSTLPTSSRRSPGPSGRRTGSRSGQLKEQFLALLDQPGRLRKAAMRLDARDGAAWRREGAAPRRRRAIGRDRSRTDVLTNTSALTEAEMMNNRPTPNRLGELEHAAARGRRPSSCARRRGDRGDHVVHQHVEPGGHAGRRSAGEEGGRARAHVSSRG